MLTFIREFLNDKAPERECNEINSINTALLYRLNAMVHIKGRAVVTSRYLDICTYREGHWIGRETPADIILKLGSRTFLIIQLSHWEAFHRQFELVHYTSKAILYTPLHWCLNCSSSMWLHWAVMYVTYKDLCR